MNRPADIQGFFTMFRKRKQEDYSPPTTPIAAPIVAAGSSERVTSVLGPEIAWKGSLSGSGGIRIEGSLDGDINLRGMLVIGQSGKVTGRTIKADMVIVSGAVQADITAQKVEIRSTGRVWGNVTTASFATEEGAFLRGAVQMEDEVSLERLNEIIPDAALPEEKEEV